jgi:hypothetical protein
MNAPQEEFSFESRGRFGNLRYSSQIDPASATIISDAILSD